MLVKIKVTPDASSQKLVVVDDTHIELQVREPASNNLANLRVVMMLAGHFGVNPKQVRIITGHHRPNKIVEIMN